MLAVSLVIPVRNEEASLPGFLSSIHRQSRHPDEVILVDGGSTDRTVALVRELIAGDLRFRVIVAGEATPGRGRNVGIAAATHDWVALTDAGIFLEPTWLDRLVEVVERDPAVDVVYGTFETALASRFERYAALAYVMPTQARPGGRMRGPIIASALLRRRVWQAVDGFPDLRAAEDLIFMERVERMAFKIGWAPAASATWHLQPSLARTFRKFVLYSKHNVWAGRQRHWHYGLARQYLVVLMLLLLGLLHNPSWLALLLLGALTRVAKSIWVRREGRRLLWLLNPVQFAGVAVILLAIDLATFVGWAQAVWGRQPPQGLADLSPRGSCNGQ
jgi:glycosyltransferase involved in cell wall biosynthesis